VTPHDEHHEHHGEHHDWDDWDETARAMGQVPTTGRGSMPFATLDGEPLVALASFALEDAGAELVDFNVELASLHDRQRALVLHDPLCPLTPVAFLREAIAVSVSEDVVVVGVQPVTDTIKTTRDGVVGETVDREGLWTVTSPVVLPASVVAGLDRWPEAEDFPALVSSLREHVEVRFLEAPALGRRVEDESALVLLEALAAEHPEDR
jgi:2-C-methyl-D-erythritol 4-phosphate cytidylyltransferase